MVSRQCTEGLIPSALPESSTTPTGPNLGMSVPKPKSQVSFAKPPPVPAQKAPAMSPEQLQLHTRNQFLANFFSGNGCVTKKRCRHLPSGKPPERSVGACLAIGGPGGGVSTVSQDLAASNNRKEATIPPPSYEGKAPEPLRIRGFSCLENSLSWQLKELQALLTWS